MLATTPDGKCRWRNATSGMSGCTQPRPLTPDLLGRLAEPVVEDREVVTGEVPDDADVLLVQAEVDPRRGDEAHVAELAGVESALTLRTGGL